MNLRTNYHHMLWNYITLSTTDYTTVATVTLVQYASVLVELVLEGEWAGAPSLYRGVFIITHNDGNTPEVRSNITSFYVSRAVQEFLLLTCHRCVESFYY